MKSDETAPEEESVTAIIEDCTELEDRMSLKKGSACRLRLIR